MSPILLGMMLLPALALGAGKKKPVEEAGIQTPNPVRRVVLKGVGTKPFQLPNGSRVDLAADLDVLLNTAVTGTTAFSPSEPGSAEDPCQTRIELRAAVSTFELNIASLGIKVGYTPSGESSVITGINGSVDAKIGTIAMDFSVWECGPSGCASVAAVTASHLTAGVELAVKLDFSQISTGPSLVFNTPLGPALRSIMNDGMKRLAASPRLNELTWRAKVREYLPGAGILIFDRGAQSRLAPNQAFVVYAAQEGVAGICDVFKAVAYAHTTQVDTVSSTAIVDQTLDARGVQDGDVVMVRAVGSSQP